MSPFGLVITIETGLCSTATYNLRISSSECFLSVISYKVIKTAGLFSKVVISEEVSG